MSSSKILGNSSGTTECLRAAALIANNRSSVCSSSTASKLRFETTTSISCCALPTAFNANCKVSKAGTSCPSSFSAALSIQRSALLICVSAPLPEMASIDFVTSSLIFSADCIKRRRASKLSSSPLLTSRSNNSATVWRK